MINKNIVEQLLDYLMSEHWIINSKFIVKWWKGGLYLMGYNFEGGIFIHRKWFSSSDVETIKLDIENRSAMITFFDTDKGEK